MNIIITIISLLSEKEKNNYESDKAKKNYSKKLFF